MKKLFLSFLVVLITIPILSMGAVSVITPNGGENWIMGCPYAIQWVTTSPSPVKIELFKSTNATLTFCMTICSLVPANMTSYTWIPPSALTAGNIYKVKISCLTNATGFDFSDNYFTISGGYFITVTSPNGGEVWVRGTTRIITWQDNIPWNVKIELWKGGVYHSLITTSTPSNGACYWAIPVTIPSGNDYKIKITAIASNASLFDFSDNNFSIMGVTYAASILDENVIKIYPNPCANILHVNFQYDSDASVRIDVLNIKGEVVIEQTLRNVTNHETIDLNTTGLQAGTYLVVVRNENEIISRDNFIVVH